MNRRGALGAIGGLYATGCAAQGLAQSAIVAQIQPKSDIEPALMVDASVKDLAGDAAIVGQALLALHPGIYRYNTADEFAKKLTQFEQDFVQAPDISRRYLVLSKFLAGIQCGHSYANFFNQSPAVQAALFEKKNRLPFSFEWIGHEMVVTADQSGRVNQTNQLAVASANPVRNNTLAPGTVVRSINGVAVKEMLRQLLPYTRVDGNNMGKRKALLGVSNSSSIEFWDVFHGLVFGEPADGSHQLQVIRPDAAGLASGEAQIVQVTPLTLKRRQAFKKVQPKDAPIWDWRMNPDSIAVLTMDSWALYDSQWDWRAWLNERLDTLRGARGLVVDIRACEGGIDCGQEILKRFAVQDIAPPQIRRMVRYQKTPEPLNPYLDTWDARFKDWGSGVTKYDERFWLHNLTQDQPIAASKAPLTVPMVVLIGPQNSSATFQFASYLKQEKLATLIGEPTGGNRRGINADAFFFTRLPASGLEFDLPLIGTFPIKAQPDSGIDPDIRVSQTAADIALGKDPVMQRALAHLKG
jgi:Peptidase family S41